MWIRRDSVIGGVARNDKRNNVKRFQRRNRLTDNE